MIEKDREDNDHCKITKTILLRKGIFGCNNSSEYVAITLQDAQAHHLMRDKTATNLCSFHLQMCNASTYSMYKCDYVAIEQRLDSQYSLL